VVDDASLLMDLPVDIVVEATGVAEDGARHAEAAIVHGKHVAMVNKEADVVVGPILKRMADGAGLVYTAVDGDQHGLLIALVEWARLLGLEVLAGGKARNAEAVLEEGEPALLRSGRQRISLSKEQSGALEPMPTGQAEAYVRRRAPILQDLSPPGGYDLVEMGIAANATGLLPDTESLHCPLVRTREIPEALCRRDHGGILYCPVSSTWSPVSEDRTMLASAAGFGSSCPARMTTRGRS
jgi:predicted homoserine dehydrogenase-like protein